MAEPHRTPPTLVPLGSPRCERWAAGPGTQKNRFRRHWSPRQPGFRKAKWGHPSPPPLRFALRRASRRFPSGDFDPRKTAGRATAV